MDAADQLTEIQIAGATYASFEYDKAGRRTKAVLPAGTWDYAYDAAGRLQTAKQGGYQLTLGYDATGQRAVRAETGAPFSAFFGEWAEQSDATETRLIHGAGIDDVVAEITGGAVRGLYLDGRANVTHTTLDGVSDGPPRRYDAFGELRAGAGATERGYAGRPIEGASGLVNMRARHYDPATGRFLQADPLGVDADQAYAYAANNPMRFADPLGLYPWSLSSLSGASAAIDIDSTIHAQDSAGALAAPQGGLTATDFGLATLGLGLLFTPIPGDELVGAAAGARVLGALAIR